MAFNYPAGYGRNLAGLPAPMPPYGQPGRRGMLAAQGAGPYPMAPMPPARAPAPPPPPVPAQTMPPAPAPAPPAVQGPANPVQRDRGTGAMGMRKRAFQQLLGYGPQFEQIMAMLMQQTDPENLAPAYASQRERLMDYFDRAQGQLGTTMAQRGLSDSSYGAAAEGALAGDEASAMGGLTGEIYERAQALQRYLPELYLKMYGLGGGLAGQHVQDRLAREALEAQQGSIWEDLIGALAGAGAAYGQYQGSRGRRPLPGPNDRTPGATERWPNY